MPSRKPIKRGLMTAGLSILALGIQPSLAAAEGTRTLKEQLSDKASDAQRVDNCHVPPERRGPEPRPDCADKALSAAPAAGQGEAAAPPSPTQQQ